MGSVVESPALAAGQGWAGLFVKLGFTVSIAFGQFELNGALPFWLKLSLATAIVFPTHHPCTYAQAQVHNRSVGNLGRVRPEEITSKVVCKLKIREP